MPEELLRGLMRNPLEASGGRAQPGHVAARRGGGRGVWGRQTVMHRNPARTCLQAAKWHLGAPRSDVQGLRDKQHNNWQKLRAHCGNPPVAAPTVGIVRSSAMSVLLLPAGRQELGSAPALSN